MMVVDAAGPTATPNFAVRKSMQRDFATGYAKAQREPFCIVDAGRQALNGKSDHGAGLPPSPRPVSME